VRAGDRVAQDVQGHGRFRVVLAALLQLVRGGVVGQGALAALVEHGHHLAAPHAGHLAAAARVALKLGPGALVRVAVLT